MFHFRKRFFFIRWSRNANEWDLLGLWLLQELFLVKIAHNQLDSIGHWRLFSVNHHLSYQQKIIEISISLFFFFKKKRKRNEMKWNEKKLKKKRKRQKGKESITCSCSWRLVRVIDTGHALELAGASLGVETLAIAPLALLERPSKWRSLRTLVRSIVFTLTHVHIHTLTTKQNNRQRLHWQRTPPLHNTFTF